jgi:hypothetical protein
VTDPHRLLAAPLPYGKAAVAGLSEGAVSKPHSPPDTEGALSPSLIDLVYAAPHRHDTRRRGRRK